MPPEGEPIDGDLEPDDDEDDTCPKSADVLRIRTEDLPGDKG